MLTNEIEVPEIGQLRTNTTQIRLEKMMSFEWVGQTLASLFWIISVFAYGGPKGLGDWLQLMAASSWMMSNVATILVVTPDAKVTEI
ncbi:MAG: hypothetical protein L7R66_03940 [Candidatus Thalassarchaeaceae archaeon]|nr:hypothetical protein [Candidatus Thalassarchaeaceae archaeon]